MSTASAPRLWIQATARKAESRAVGPEALGTVFLATLASSGVGALIKTAADRLLADNEFTLSDTLAFDPAFHAPQPGGQGEFLVSAITLNVGPKAVTLEPDGVLSEDTVSGAARAGWTARRWPAGSRTGSTRGVWTSAPRCARTSER